MRGQYLESKRIASLYRIHEKPDPKRVYDFETIAAKFGYSLGVGPLPVQRVQMKTDRRAAYGTGKRARDIEIPEEVHITPRMYQKLTEKIAGKPEERILSYLMLRSLKQARYSEENEGHFALAAPELYAFHFAHPAVSGPDRAPHSERCSARRTDGSEVRTRSASRAAVAGAPRPGMSHHTDAATPWSKRRDHAAHRESLSNRLAGRSRSKSCTTSRKNPASPSAEPMKPSAS